MSKMPKKEEGHSETLKTDAGEKRRKYLLDELRKKLKKTSKEEADSDEETSEEEIPEHKKSKTMRGNKLAVKQERAIELGWLHEGQQVRKLTGGGTRKITVSKDATADVIIKHATNLFFPDGISRRGITLEDVDLSLCDFSMCKTLANQTVGETYEKEKPSGILRWYLSSTMKAHATGQSPSSGPIDSSSSTSINDCQDLDRPPTFQQEKKPPSTTKSSVPLSDDGLYPVLKGEVCVSQQPINITYFKNVQSLYSDKISRITASRSQCVHTHGSDTYDPLEDGYSVGEISKDDKCFVLLSDSDTSEGTTYKFPSATEAESPDPFLILHHPDEVWGMEEGKLVVAVVSQHHNNTGVSYQWFCDTQPISNGCILRIEKPGHYYCVLKAVIQQGEDGEQQEVTRSSNTVQVVKLSSTKVLPVPTKELKHANDSSDIEEMKLSDVSCDFTEAINHGSFGEVFKGTYKEAHVAVKRIKMKQGKRPDKMIQNEASIHKLIAHKNIVKFVGTYMEPCYVFVVTEFIEGQNMEDMIYLHDDQVDMPNKKISVAVGVLEGVCYLHEHDPQIIHQDIKPANILLDRNLLPKLCDLGLAKVRSFGAASTTSGVFAAGTPEYMAPEILLNNHKGTASTDIWSLGLTLIEWFSGRDPWNLQNQEEEPITYIRHCMQNKKIPVVLQSSKFPLLLPCVSYVPTNRPTARHVLKRFQCPSCSNIILP